MSISETAAPLQLRGRYEIDPSHTRIGFVARHAMVTKVRGSFRKFEGHGFFDPDHPSQSNVVLTIDARSIETGHEDRDNHLRSNDFFDMDAYPEITFSSTAILKFDETDFRVTGNLTIKGVTKPVTIDFDYTGSSVDPYGKQRVGFEGRASVNRRDWGVNWNAALEAGGVLVSDKVELEFDVSAIKSEE